jgi:hypothetical protein
LEKFFSRFAGAGGDPADRLSTSGRRELEHIQALYLLELDAPAIGQLALVDLLPIDDDVGRGVDGKSNLLAVYGRDGDGDVITDDDGFAYAAR